MTEFQLGKAPRMVTYCCSHAWDGPKGVWIDYFERWLSMLLLAEPGQSVTHINLDEPSDNTDELNGRIYSEVKQIQAQGIKVLTQLTFFWGRDGFGQDGEFNEHLYRLLHRMLTRSGFDGVDLDVEDFATDSAKVTSVIKRLKEDFGPDFLITMAPGGRELLDRSSPGHNQLSSIYYKELYNDIGSDIDWFNVQLYNGWGQLSLPNFEDYIKAGTNDVVYPADKIVMSVASNWKNANSHDWTPGDEIQDNLPKILAAYPDMGGISCWEWYNAVLAPVKEEQTILHPEKWFRFVYKIMRDQPS
ncbi:MAG: hypothetical protein M1822_008957 [Bathelium mastoideum]|nr:MAG: hypothetical protein M1822_008957 [Bathelium mastoideum]